MNEEEKQILLDVQKQVQKNNKILKGIQSKNRRAAFGKIIYYAVLILISMYIWTYLQPVYESLMDVAGKVSESGSGLEKLLQNLEKLTSMTDKFNLK